MFVIAPWERTQYCDKFWQIEAGDRLAVLNSEGDTDLVATAAVEERGGSLAYTATVPEDNRVAHPPQEPKKQRKGKHRHRKDWGIP